MRENGALMGNKHFVSNYTFIITAHCHRSHLNWMSFKDITHKSRYSESEFDLCTFHENKRSCVCSHNTNDLQIFLLYTVYISD